MKIQVRTALIKGAAILAVAFLTHAGLTSPQSVAAQESERPADINPRPKQASEGANKGPKIRIPNTITIVKSNTPPPSDALGKREQKPSGPKLASSEVYTDEVHVDRDFYLYLSASDELADVILIARYATLKEVNGNPVFATDARLYSGSSGDLDGSASTGYFTGRKVLTVPSTYPPFPVKVKIKSTFMDKTDYNGIHILIGKADANGEFTHVGHLFLYVRTEEPSP
jgi:hypothetical protein